MTGAEATLLAAAVAQPAALMIGLAAWRSARRGERNTAPDGHLTLLVERALHWQGAHDEHHRIVEGTVEAAPPSPRPESPASVVTPASPPTTFAGGFA